MTTASKMDFFKHKVGDGLHYINDNFIVFENGQYQDGETSDSCVLLNLQRLCTVSELPPLWELWSTIYPEDPLTREDAACLIDDALPFTEPCNPLDEKTQRGIIKDVRAVGLAGLADYVSELLSKG